MVTININGREVEAEAGRRLVEVIKEQGISITNLCYIDGLEPYAGCRTCIVDVEGGRPTSLQLSCTAQVAEGMIVRTNTPEVKSARQGVMSLIMANHPDRCLTCHRRVHCQPGEICLRDDVVTHRCLTCAKNYRCELQTSTEMIDMGEYEEPWVGEPRSYYETPPPEPDRGNPFLEFDPQMCIICTRCVRACADIRHTGAIALSGRGSSTAIAFGTGGPVHESNCDFCGACIDACPTAALMEKPNKWVSLAEDWTNSSCNSCAVGCTLSYGVRDARPVIVRPDRVNQFSRDQICVRGRFHYDAVPAGQRLSRSLVRRGNRLLPAPAHEALAAAAEALGRVREQHGGQAIAVLGSPLATNEEAYLLAKLARDVLGTPHIDFSHGPIHRAVASAFRDGLGVERLPSSYTDIEQAQTIVVVAGDLEESHPVASMRVKDAVIKRGARLVLVSPRWGELVPFAEAWVQPRPGHEASTVHALAQAVASRDGNAGAPAGLDGAAFERAASALRAGATTEGRFAVVFAPNPVVAAEAGQQARACVNLAVASRGDAAAGSLHYFPTDANVLGITDMGVIPLGGSRSFPEIVQAARRAEIRALVVHDDNPLLNAAGTDDIRAALEALDVLVVIDSVRSTTAQFADVVLAELPFFAKDGTLTTGDRRINRQRPAALPRGEERDGVAILVGLIRALGGGCPDTPGAVMAEAAMQVPGYVGYDWLQSGRTRALGTAEAASATARWLQVDPPPMLPFGRMALMTGRTLYTSFEGASIRSEEADKLHREEAVVMNPHDAEVLRIRAGDTVSLSDGVREVMIAARLDDGVAPGTLFVPHYYDGGAVMQLFPLEGTGDAIVGVRVRVPVAV